ncbi:hypothetical protein [Shewanella sp. 30m-9]
MTPDMTIWIGAAATILAAFIAGTVALTSTVIAKEQKISEFRLAWIDAFRNDIVELIACGTKVSALASITEVNSNHAEKSFQARAEYFSIATKINLRLNCGDGLNLLYEIDRLMHTVTYGESKNRMIAVTDVNHEIIKISQEIISVEWEKVKQGELLNRFFIGTGKVLMGSSITAFFFYVLYSGFPRYCPVVG